MQRPVPRRRTPDGSSIGGSFVTAAILALPLVATSYPVAFAGIVLVVATVAVVARVLWRRATADGLDIPGSTGTIRVEKPGRSRRNRDHVRWSLIVTFADREHDSSIDGHVRTPRSNVD